MGKGKTDESGKKYLLRLYIAGRTARSLKAVANLESICRDHLCENYDVDIVDILVDPIRALEEGVLVTPTLVKLSPLPVKTIVGDLSDRETVLFSLDLKEGYHDQE